MSYFYSQQAYQNVMNQADQLASLAQAPVEEAQEEKTEQKEAGTELIATSLPFAIQGIAKFTEKAKSIYEAGTKLKTAVGKGVKLAEEMPEKLTTLSTKLQDIGEDAVDKTKTLVATKAEELKGIAQSTIDKFKSFGQERLNTISSNVKSQVDSVVEKAKQRLPTGELTPELQSKYNQLIELSKTPTAENIAKLQDAYKDFKTTTTATIEKAGSQKIEEVSSLGKKAISRLPIEERVNQIKGKIQDLTVKRDQTIERLKTVRDNKIDELTQRKNTIQNKLDEATQRQQRIQAEPMEPKLISPEATTYRSSGSVRGIGKPVASEDISSYKRQLQNLDSEIESTVKNHLSQVEQISKAHLQEIDKPVQRLSKIAPEEASNLTSKLGSVLDVVGKGANIGFGLESAVSLGESKGKQPVMQTLNDVNMMRHGATDVVDTGKKALTSFKQGTEEFTKQGGEVVQQAKADLQKGIEEGAQIGKNAVSDAEQVGKAGIQAGKQIGEDVAENAGKAIAESSVADIVPVVGEIADASLLFFSLFSGIKDLVDKPKAPPMPTLNVVHQSGVY